MTRAFGNWSLWFLNVKFPSHPAKSLILCFGQQPRIFDLCRWASAAQYADDFSGGVALAVDVGFVGVSRGVAGDDDVGEHGAISITTSPEWV